ncbi:Retrovirus-related Pol polyprotein, partial [Mucuna pruriens]
MEVFMDDFTVYATSFDACLENQSRGRGIEVDKSKIDIITSLPNPTFVREVCLFLGHIGFYRRFIKNFNKMALPSSKLLQKDVDLNFDQPYIEAFQELKTRLTSAPILQAPNLEYSFELIHIRPTSRSRQTVTRDRICELLAIVFALDKFSSYLLGSKIIIFNDHATLRFLLKKLDVKLRLIW